MRIITFVVSAAMLLYTPLFTSGTLAQELLSTIEETVDTQTTTVGQVFSDDMILITDTNFEEVRIAAIKGSYQSVSRLPSVAGMQDEEVFAMTLTTMHLKPEDYTLLKGIWIPSSSGTAVYWFFYMENEFVDWKDTSQDLPVNGNAKIVGGLEMLYNASHRAKPEAYGKTRRDWARFAFSTEQTSARVHNAQGVRLGDLFRQTVAANPNCTDGCRIITLSWDIDQDKDQSAVFWFEFLENELTNS